MAAAAAKSGESGIFWINDASDEEQPMVFVPGVNREMKFQTPLRFGPGGTSSATEKGTKMRAKRGSEPKAEAPVNKGGKKKSHLQSGPVIYAKGKELLHPNNALSMEHIPPPPTSNFLPMPQVIPATSHAQSQVCLKDLCPEDKRRIANLIQELARVSEEKEESVQRLKDEQESFERKIQQLEQQNLLIVRERESLQQQYKECQELLGLYQQYLSQQQERLNQSIAQLSQPPPHSKLSSSEGVPSRVNGSVLDGSYLALAATQAGWPPVHRGADGRRGAAKTLSDHVSLSTMTIPSSSPSGSERTPTEGSVKQQSVQKGERSVLYSESYSRSEHYPDSGYRTQPQKTNDPLLANGHHGNQNRLLSVEAMGPEAKEALTRPLLGHEDWEEKRHQLLLQKMQLEMERERLWARLTEQEAQLRSQNQQLRQSRLDYNRFQQATQAEHGSSVTRNGAPQPEGLSKRHSPSRVCEDEEVRPVGPALNEELPQTSLTTLHNSIDVSEALQQSRRDMATSPVKTLASLSNPTSVPVRSKTPEARLDSSVTELLQAFSPVSVPGQCKPSTQRHKTPRSVNRPAVSAPRPVHSAVLSPAGPYPQSFQQDLEESQILEEIFFIC
ncbi:protein hinderin isoform X2 [Myripristis murdjan]|uniref:Zgc:162344 n=1 Tax=Myripristis murdjan TaxID=586833 RepID=A0A667YJK8_9TELE|nr:protein hinderin isoform X2 [Myripristis murdjan]